MKITFRINYRTYYGQQILMEIMPNQKTLLLNPKANGDWELTIENGDKPQQDFKYRYLMKDSNTSSTLYEFGERTFSYPKINTDNIFVHDFWKPALDTQNIMMSSAFKNVIFGRTDRKDTTPLETCEEKKLPIRVSIPVVRIHPSHYLAVKFLAPLPEDNKMFELSDKDFPLWTAEFELDRPKQYSEYKYCICDRQTGKVVIEEYVTRYFQPTSQLDDTFYILNDEDFKYPRYPWKAAGVAVPVFSLRSEESFGVGEFADLIKLIDWAKSVGLQMIQILPVNDTVKTHTYTDSYPYACVSVFALHPIYLRIKDMGPISSEVSKEIYEERQHALNSLGKIDYETVMNVKSRFFKMIYDENKRAFLQEPAYKEFFAKNSSWLKPYAVFSYLRDLYGTPDYTRWGKFAIYNQEKIDELCREDNPDYDDIGVHFFIQYHLYLQLSKVSDYARKNGIVLKGDIPIGISKNSVDAWVNPNLYHLDAQAGAPPDDFSDDGQNWRFPTYNWEEMAKDGIKWWKERLINMAQYFDAYRIDHILGFFRIWSIPRTQTRGLMGVFDPAVPIDVKEFAGRGIDFNYDRFCRPYIRKYMLDLIFNDHAGYVRHTFLDKIEGTDDEYRFKEEYNTQAKIEAAFETMAVPTTEDMLMFQKIKHGLIYLVSDLLFFQDKNNPNAYHPRHSLFKTYSYKDLDTRTKQVVADLYNDYFYNRNEGLWKQQAEIKLPGLTKSTEMLVCGEDLGMIPACVPEVMRNLNILSLEIQRMPKETAIEFGRPANYPYMSVATTSSHDTLPIRGWWEEDHSRSQRFYNNMLGKSGQAPFFCETWVVKEIILSLLYAPSMWAVFPIQDFLGLDANLRSQDPADERINVPSDENHYWRYRCHISLEQLAKAENLNKEIKEMLGMSARMVAY